MTAEREPTTAASHDHGRHPGRRPVIVTAVILASLVYALIVNLDALDNPPAWDSAITVSPAALTIVESDFDVWEVAQLPSSLEGGPSTHATSLFTIGLALLIWLFGPSSAFYIAHLTSIALVGALAAATYHLARLRSSARVSALAAMAVSFLPLVIQQASDVYLDLPLAVIATVACWAACRRHFWATAVLVLLGIAIKTSGVFLFPLLLLARPIGQTVRRHLVQVLGAGTVALIPLLASLATTHRFDDGGPSFDPTLIRSTASTLLLTTDVFVLLSIYVLVVYGRVRSRNLDRATRASLIVVTGFFAIHTATIVLSGTIIILPRYYIAVVPAILVALLPTEENAKDPRSPARKASLGLVLVLAIFSLINIRGDFYPLPDHDFYVIAERSTRAQDLLELQVLGTRELISTRLPMLVERQVYFQLSYPYMGYVDETPDDMTPVFFESPDDLPEKFALLIERRFANPLVLIEEAALEQGYRLDYETLSVGPFQSELIVASK